jgi:hypothetical protein
MPDAAEVLSGRHEEDDQVIGVDGCTILDRRPRQRGK